MLGPQSPRRGNLTFANSPLPADPFRWTSPVPVPSFIFFFQHFSIDKKLIPKSFASQEDQKQEEKQIIFCRTWVVGRGHMLVVVNWGEKLNTNLPE